MNANDTLKQHTSTDNYYEHLFGCVFTDGVRALATEYECYWLLDVIVSYQPSLKHEDFQVWTLQKHGDSSCTVTATDGNDNILKQQRVPYTDFKADTCIVWVESTVLLLPSEH
ncbi:MAG: hypothetical protein QM737_02810 [Ferruginibacter sp.]